MITEQQMLENLKKNKLALEPLQVSLTEGPSEVEKNRRFDAFVEVAWGEQKAKFVVECKALSTPKLFQGALNQIKTSNIPQGWYPLVFVPFLNQDQITELRKEGVSGIDLCGNCIVSIPGRFSVLRTGGINRFTSSAPIKNIYRKNSSMVGRAFLARPQYNSVGDILSEINQRNPLVKGYGKNPITFATVSKALKALEEDLIVDRQTNIRLLQTEKLLEKLAANYEAPKIKEKVLLKFDGGDQELRQWLFDRSKSSNLPITTTGLSSVNLYAVMQRGETLSVYCPRTDEFLEKFPGVKTEKFPDLELVETEDELVYFDSRMVSDFWWASPVQTYLELMKGDKRDQETAEQVKTVILNDSQRKLI